MRVTLDTNVLFAGYAAHGFCEALLAGCLERHAIVLSEHILAELSEHLAGKLKFPASRIAAIEQVLRSNAEIVLPAPIPHDLCPDPDDLPILGTVIAGRCEVLVTGDRTLLAL